MNASSSVVSSDSCNRDCSSSPITTLGPTFTVPPSGAWRPRISSSSVDLPLPLWPRMPTRSPAPIVSVIGPSRNDPTDAVASSRRATIAPLRAASPNVRRSCHASRGSSTTSRRSIAFSVRAALPASCSLWLIWNALMFLSFSSVSFLALLNPCVAHSRSRWARRAGCSSCRRTPRSARGRAVLPAHARRGTPPTHRRRATGGG